MYAVIETGGKQYRVEVGTELEVELLEAEPGAAISLDRILLVADGDEAAIGRPIVEGAAVDAEVLRRDRGPKLISFKYRPKARRRVTKGHRQGLTILRINDIRFGGKSAADAARKAAQDALTERQRLEEAAARQAAADAKLAARLAETKAKAEASASDEAEAGTTGRARKATKPATPKTTRAGTTKTTAKTKAAKTAGSEPAAAKPARKTGTRESAAKEPTARTSKTSATTKEATAPDAGDTPAKPAAPKRPRATKKDE